jgi:hypothetical protein
MISIEIDAKQLKQLRKAVAKAGKQFPRELAAAVNKVAKKTKGNIGKEIRKTVNLKKEPSERPIKLRRTATAQQPTGIVGIDREQRLGLQHFGARHDKRGVSYKIAKQGGRKRVDGAFMGPRPGTLAPKLNGGAFRREGESRLPIVKLKGVSPYGAYAKNDLSKAETKLIQSNLRTEMQRRIDFNILRANGLKR